ncbi:hypothetical protein CEXT_523211 [Caerostris extrusa]|uniref:Uncharacterized protein n=1 Tax=Caerostris extrusa TaxID=172846 RepID=A0AAV4SJR1_CAEEX|nr:hypothetical protein CEXT_523211 [Caerostris extrusa]
MFSGRKASRTNIHFSPDRCAFARGYGCFPWNGKDRKEKKKKAVMEHIRVKLCMFLFSAAPAAHILSFPVRRRNSALKDTGDRRPSSPELFVKCIGSIFVDGERTAPPRNDGGE